MITLFKILDDMAPTQILDKLTEFKAGVLEEIKNIVLSVGGELNIDDLNEGCSPVLLEDPLDPDNTFTLDRIQVKASELLFDGSSCFQNATWKNEELDITRLVYVLDFLERHKDEIEELKTIDNFFEDMK